MIVLEIILSIVVIVGAFVALWWLAAMGARE